MKFDLVRPGMIFETYARAGVPSETWAIIDIDRDGGRLLYDKGGRRRVWCSATIWNARSSQIKLVGGAPDGNLLTRPSISTKPAVDPIIIRTSDDQTALLREIKDLLAEVLVELKTRGA